MCMCVCARTHTFCLRLLVEVGRRPAGPAGWERLALSPAVSFPLYLVEPQGP